MTQNVVSETFPSRDRMIPRNDVIEALEEPVCEMADNANIALGYITGILADLELEGHLSRHKVTAACRILGSVATAAAQLRETAYSLMEAPATIETQPTSLCEAVKTLSAELRIDWALSEYAEDAGSDEDIEARQRDRVYIALEKLEELVAH